MRIFSLARQAGSYDLVVSNPPYVGKNEPEKVQQIVRDWEPEVAVFGGRDRLGNL